MVDACGVGTEENNEFVVINSGGGFNTSNLQLSFDANNSGFSNQNNDINIDIDNFSTDPLPCSLQAGDPSVYLGCTNLIPVGLGINIPPNSIVVLQTSSNADFQYDFSSLCGSGECVYIIQSTCARTMGGFTNEGSGIRETILAIDGSACYTSYIYDRANLSDNHGDYYLPGSDTYGNDGCVVPPSSPATAPVTPNLDPIGPFCDSDAAVALNTTQDGITGNWSGSGVSANQFDPSGLSGTITLTFTPDPGQCAIPNTLDVSVSSGFASTFDPVGPLCETDSPVDLPDTSNEGYTGNWDIDPVDPTGEGGNTITATFTPDAGQCASSATMNIIVNATTTPTFNTVGPLCESDSPVDLPNTSNEGITGNWDIDPVDPAGQMGSTITVIFTPTAGQCASSTTMDIVVENNIMPIFDLADDICENDSPWILSNTSVQGITGSWDINPVDPAGQAGNIISASFTPNAGQGCAVVAIIDFNIIAATTPTFNAVGPLCETDSPVDLPNTSNEGITGSWNSDPIDPAGQAGNTITVTFTPDPGQCATSADMDIVVSSEISPTFGLSNDLCENDPPLVLSNTSLEGITGIWDINPVDPSGQAGNTIPATFIPDAGQGCASQTTIDFLVAAATVPVFDALGPLCESDSPVTLPNLSNNGILGTWDINPVDPAGQGGNTISANFTPDAGECATSTTIDIVVTTDVTPTFDPVGPICENDSPFSLPNTSNEGITGSWDINPIDPAGQGGSIITSTFTPDGRAVRSPCSTFCNNRSGHHAEPRPHRTLL